MIITVLECYHMYQDKTLAVDTSKNVEKGLFYGQKHGENNRLIGKNRRKEAAFRASNMRFQGGVHARKAMILWKNY